MKPKTDKIIKPSDAFSTESQLRLYFDIRSRELARKEILLDSLQRKAEAYKQTIERQRAQIREMNDILCNLLHEETDGQLHSPEQHLRLYYHMYEED